MSLIYDIFLAASNNDLPKFLEISQNPKVRPYMLRNGFMKFVENNNIDAVKTLIELLKLYEDTSLMVDSALISVKKRNLEMLKVLLSYSTDTVINESMVESAVAGYPEIVKFLLEEKNANAQYRFNEAINFTNNKEVEQILMNYGAVKQNEKYQVKTRKTNAWIADWIKINSLDKNFLNLTPELISDLKNTVKPKTYTVYRGLKFSSPFFKEWNLKLDQFREGQYFNLHMKTLTSWTTDVIVAYEYAVERGAQADDPGIILKMVVEPRYVIADLTSYGIQNPILYSSDTEILQQYETGILTDKHSEQNQCEVILYPGMYKVLLMRLFRYNPNKFYKEISIDDEPIIEEVKPIKIEPIKKKKKKKIKNSSGGGYKKKSRYSRRKRTNKRQRSSRRKRRYSSKRRT